MDAWTFLGFAMGMTAIIFYTLTGDGDPVMKVIMKWGNYIYRKYNEALIKIMPVVSCDIALQNFVSPVSGNLFSPF